jgi:hypothetical protein
MELLSIETLEEQQEIVAIISRLHLNLLPCSLKYQFLREKLLKGEYEESFWTSGSDNEAKNYFYWESTGHAFGPYYNWASGQPDDGATLNLTDQNCVVLDHENSYTWHDLGCKADQLRFICEERGEGLYLQG